MAPQPPQQRPSEPIRREIRAQLFWLAASILVLFALVGAVVLTGHVWPGLTLILLLAGLPAIFLCLGMFVAHSGREGRLELQGSDRRGFWYWLTAHQLLAGVIFTPLLVAAIVGLGIYLAR